MTARRAAWVLAAVLAAGAARAETPAPAKRASEAAAAAARRAWAITDLVLEHDIDPPARQQMLLDGARALLSRAPKADRHDLAARVSAVTTPGQFAVLLAEVWPAKPGAEDGEGPEEALFRGLFAGRVGGYLTPRQRRLHEEFAGNRYVGTGVQIRQNDEEKLPQIVVPIPGGPARKAGARAGDLIVSVDGHDMKGQPLREVVRRLQGEDGTKVSVIVRRPGETTTRRLDMVRSVVPFTSVHGYRRTGEDGWSFRVGESSVGYLSVEEIKSSTPLELRRLEPLLRGEGARALVLDLRFARGEDVRHAALTADALIDGGVLWRVRDARGRIKEYKADRDCLFRDWPMAVLVGPHTEGTARLLAAALQDRGRAVLVGEPTRVGLPVTSLVPLGEGEGALLLRTGDAERVRGERPATPGGAVVPDERVGLDRKAAEAVLIWRHEQNSPEPKADARPPDDPQLDRAAVRLIEALGKHGDKNGK